MTRYAERTTVPISKSRTDIEKTLKRYGATGFAYFEEGSKAAVAFKKDNRHVRISLNIPDGDTAKHEREARRLWRCLGMIVKAKLESVASGVTIFDDEFMSHIVMPDGSTIGDHVRPKIASAYQTGEMPTLLPGPGHERPNQ